MTVKEAQQQGCCRICGKPFRTGDRPIGWETLYRQELFPEHIVLNYGKEFAHAVCLNEINDSYPLTALTSKT